MSQVSRVCDAHVHLFRNGFVGPSGEHPGGYDELAAYEALRVEHGIQSALVVGYEGEDTYRGNNAYVLARAAELPWIRPLVFADTATTTAADVESALAKGAYGVSAYGTDPACMRSLSDLLCRIAAPLVERHALLSLNVVPALYPLVRELGETFPEQRVLLSHLGLPAAGARTAYDAVASLRSLGRLADGPSVFVKASGFYALAGLAAPHDALAMVVNAFGADRVLWGSDFSPVLAHQSFPEALDVVESAPLPDVARRAIMGGTLAKLLNEVER